MNNVGVQIISLQGCLNPEGLVFSLDAYFFPRYLLIILKNSGK